MKRLMVRSGRLVLVALVSLVVVPGCSGVRESSEVLGPSVAGEIVVDGVLIVGRPLPVIAVTRTTRVEEPWDSQSGVEGASVRVIFPGGEVEYLPRIPAGRGFYTPDGVHTVQEGTVYRLEVLTPDLEVVAAQTTTPVGVALQRTVLLDDDGETVLRELRSFRSGGDPYVENELIHGVGSVEAKVAAVPEDVFQVGLFSLDLDSEYVVDVSFLPDDVIAELQRNNTSPALVPQDGGIRLPWAAVIYEGRYLIRIHSIDRNWYDLIRSSPEFGGGTGFGGNAGDNFERPIFHVEGGVGLFGSAAVDSVGITVLPPPDSAVPGDPVRTSVDSRTDFPRRR